MAELLKIEHVSKTYISGGTFWGGEKITALKDVSFCVEEGESFGLLFRLRQKHFGPPYSGFGNARRRQNLC